uniref:Laminin IV type A domain-containing protein n=1 Tax=Anopheles farauti TaxID=69004 RepID=A0A182QGL7_9DIPT
MAMNDWKMWFATWDGRGEVKAVKNPHNFPTNQSLYYSLPYRFIEYQVKSYGGYLQLPVESEQIPEIFLMGYNRTLVFRGQPATEIFNGTIQIQLQETNFVLHNGTAIDRIEFLTVLAYIDRILIRMFPTKGRYEPSPRSIVMDSASDYQRGIGKAHFVEECRCPAGFRGTSCERCDFGYNRAFVGPPMGVCMPWEWHRNRYVPTSTTPRTYHYV